MTRSIAEIRRDSGVIQRDAASFYGISQSTWSRHERKEPHPIRQNAKRKSMLQAVKQAAKAQGSGIQVHVDDFVKVSVRRKS